MDSQPARRRPQSLYQELSDMFAPLIPGPRGRPVLGGHTIRVEEKRENDRYIVRAEIPGLNPDEDIEVNVRAGKLILEAERTADKTEGGRSEFRYGSFTRTVSLPPGAKTDDIEASYAKGILTVSVGIGEEETKTKRIEIKTTK